MQASKGPVERWEGSGAIWGQRGGGMDGPGGHGGNRKRGLGAWGRETRTK